MCVAQAEATKEAAKAGILPPEKDLKMGNAFVVYQGSTMCKRHMFERVRNQMAKRSSVIAVPTVESKIKLT